MSSATTIAAVAAVASAAMAGVSAIQQGQAASSQAKMQSELYRRQAEREQQIGAINAAAARRQADALAGTQRATMGGGSRDSSSGSALLIQEDLAGEGELNAKRAENNAQAAATNLRANAAMAAASGQSAQSASYYRAGSALLGGAEGATNLYKSFQ
jgi:hypothetical protein